MISFIFDSLIPGIWQYAIPFLVILSVVVFVHEFGHYWVARRNGVRVESFSIGFGPEIFGKTDSAGTRWRLALVPLGGYVKMLGDADPTGMSIDARVAHERDSFPAKTVWQRMAVVVAGPVANFIFAIVVLAALFSISGRPLTPAIVGEVVPETPAAAAGILEGDRILAVDGREIESFEQLQAIVRDQAGVPLELAIERAGAPLALTVTPSLREQEDVFGNIHEVGQLGISRTGIEFVRSHPLMAPLEAVQETGRIIGGTVAALFEMLIGARSTEELGGPLRIAQMSGQVAQDGFVPALWFTAVLSINLGLINLFPIPMLDGGHIVFYAIEAIRGRPMNERAQEIAFRIGLAMVLTLMVFATWNDVNLMFSTWLRSLLS